MASNLPKKNRPDYLANIAKLAEGFREHSADIPQLVVGGTVSTNAQIVARLNGRIDQAKIVGTTYATWKTAVEADRAATEDLKDFLSNIRQAVLVILAGKTDALGDFGLTMRKKPATTAEVKATAALKAKATRTARGTKSKKQKARIVANVEVIPATVVPVKRVPEEAGGVTPTASPVAAPAPAAPVAPTLAAAPATPPRTT
jgi:hypothetical protein